MDIFVFLMGKYGCMMGIWGYLWMHDRYMKVYLDV